MGRKVFFLAALIVLININGFSQLNIEKPADTVQYLVSTNWDLYNSWGLNQQSGSQVSKSNYTGINNNGVVVIYKFASTGGWFDMNMGLKDTLTKTYPIVFYIRSSSLVSDNLEIKFTDKDGSVFRRVVPLNNFKGQWNHVTVYLGDTEYAWGGDSKFDAFASFSIAASGNSTDTIWLDEIGIGKPGLRTSFPTVYDPDSTLAGIGFAQRRDSQLNPEDTLVLKYLKVVQDKSSSLHDLLPSQEDDQAQTFNNCLAAMAFMAHDEKSRAERILDYYSNATNKSNTDKTLQNFYYNGEARGFYQWVSLNTRHAPANTVDRWVGDMAWLLITCKYYEKTYVSNRYDELIKIIKDLLISFYKDADYGGYIQSGWRSGDTYLHEVNGHPEGNIDCYVALKLSGENYYAQKIKIWIEHSLYNQKTQPLDLYTWRVLAFGKDYAPLLNIPEFNYCYRKVMDVKGIQTMGFYNSYDLYADNFWNDGTGHIACAYQAFGDKERGYFYANQLDHLIIERTLGTFLTHTIPYTLNKTAGYSWVDTTKGFVSSVAWYILAKNSINPFMSENFKDTVLSVSKNNFQVNGNGPYPDPFSEFVNIDLSLPSCIQLSVIVYDILGKKIQELFHDSNKSGQLSLTWDGTDSNGTKVKPGVYFLNISGGNTIYQTYKIVKIAR